MPVRARAILFATSLFAAALFAALPAPTRAAGPKVAIIVGPTAISEQYYVPWADNVAATAQAAGATVVKSYCASATAANVLAAVQGASIVVYFGHGNGFPNPYSSTLDPASTNGWGLARGTTGCTDSNLRYYGESWIAANARPATGFTMIYSNACYAPGAGENEIGSPTNEATAKSRVGYYSRGVLGMGAGAYFASDLWRGSARLVDLVLRNPTMSYGDIFRAGNGFQATALRTFTHPNVSGAEVWLHRSADYGGTMSYWYAYAGNPGQTPSGAASGTPPPPLVTADVTRLAGADRFATSAIVSGATFAPNVAVAYVATGANFPDALAGGAAATRAGGPVLLLTRDAIPASVGAELSRLKPQRIVVLGGPGVVSDGVVGQLDAYTAGTVTRQAGADRYATAAAISQASFAGGAAVAYIATGPNFPDALTGGPAAGVTGGPILLVSPSSIPGATAAELNRLRPGRIVILGGTAVVTDGVAGQLAAYTAGGVSRLAGADRYLTANAISAGSFASAGTVYVVTGRDFPDALAAAPAAGKARGPLLLVPGSSLPASVAGELDRLNPSRVIVVGTDAAVSESVLSQIRSVLGG